MDETIQPTEPSPPQIITPSSPLPSSTSSSALLSTTKSFFRRSPSPTPLSQMRKNLLPQAVESTAAIMSTTAAAVAIVDSKSTKSSSAMLQSGSATGNPRNKCALKPGHSLMDWVRLGSSGVDLAGTNGIITPVSHTELAKHNRRDDAWLAIRGKVYNVTRYMDFHPGGVDELMKGVGIDATKLFDDVHAWVNYEQLLGKCLIGPLRNVVTLNIASSTTKSASADGNRTKERTQSIAPNGGTFKTPFLPFMSLDKSLSMKQFDAPVAPAEIVPRFDWIQKTTNLTLVFYTKSLCNPGIIIVGDVDSKKLDISVQIECVILHSFSFQLLHEVEWPPTAVVVNQETGKIEIALNKTVPALWSNYGSLNRRKLLDEISNCDFTYEITQRTRISHDSYALVLRSANQRIVHQLPIGYHVKVSAEIPGESMVTRSYTPVPAAYVPSITSDTMAPHLLLLVKSYPDGSFTKHLAADEIPFNEVIVSHAKGNFHLDRLKQHTRIAMLAAGSGITPMLPIIDHLLQRKLNRLEMLTVLYFNKTKADIWCKDVFDSLAKSNLHLKFRFVLSQASESDGEWDGEVGRMSTEIADSLATETSTSYSTFCLICGPAPFNDLCQTELNAAGFEDDVLHFFRG